jgi:hypothetical protein
MIMLKGPGYVKIVMGTSGGMDGYFWIPYGHCGVDKVMFGINGFSQTYTTTKDSKEGCLNGELKERHENHARN